MEYGSEIVFFSKIKRKKKTILLGLWKDFDAITVENNVICRYNSLNLKYHHLGAVGWGQQTYPAPSCCPDLPAPRRVTWSLAARASLHFIEKNQQASPKQIDFPINKHIFFLSNYNLLVDPDDDD